MFDILFTTATDIGDPATNGHGIIDIDAAMAPIGTTSLAIKTVDGLLLGDTGEGGVLIGGAFGDGFSVALGSGAIFTDRYDRAYVTDLDGKIETASPFVDFLSRFDAMESFAAAAVPIGSKSVLRVSSNYEQQPTGYERQIMGLEAREDGVLDGVQMRLDTQVAETSAMTVAFGGSAGQVLGDAGDSLAGTTHLSMGARLPWLTETASTNGFSAVENGGRRYGARHLFGNGLELSVAVAEDRLRAPELGILDSSAAAERRLVAARLGGRFAGTGFAVSAGEVHEDGSVLGSYSTGIYAVGDGSRTRFLSLQGERVLGVSPLGRVSLFGSTAMAHVDIDEAAASAFYGFEGLAASQMALGLAFDGAVWQGDRVTLTLSQPLRLENGGAVYGFASGYDYGSETAQFDSARRSLAPSGRELDLELGWAFGLGEADMSANLLYQKDPGHVSGRDDVMSLMITGRRQF